jgi:hypothetical protein
MRKPSGNIPRPDAGESAATCEPHLSFGADLADLPNLRRTGARTKTPVDPAATTVVIATRPSGRLGSLPVAPGSSVVKHPLWLVAALATGPLLAGCVAHYTTSTTSSGYVNAPPPSRPGASYTRSVYLGPAPAGPAPAAPVTWRQAPAPAPVSAPARPVVNRPAAAPSAWGSAPNAAPATRVAPVSPAARMQPGVMAVQRPAVSPTPHSMPTGSPVARMPPPAPPAGNASARTPFVPRTVPAAVAPSRVPSGAHTMPAGNQTRPGASAVMSPRRPAPQPVQPRN